MLASRRAEQRRRASNRDADDFSVDDGDEDAWAHDGIDDIHIDPETKRAASELSLDEKSIDAEYDQAQVPNRTRVTTISEVIPMTSNNQDSGQDNELSIANDKDSTRISSRFLPAPSKPTTYLPAAMLSLEEAQQIIGQQYGSRAMMGNQRRAANDDDR